jgi:hypothetical protein
VSLNATRPDLREQVRESIVSILGSLPPVGPGEIGAAIHRYHDIAWCVVVLSYPHADRMTRHDRYHEALADSWADARVYLTRRP